MNRKSIAETLRTVADRIDPPQFGVKIVWDEYHETEGSYAYGSDEEDARAVAEELAKLESGEWVVIGMIAYERDSRGNAYETDVPASLWGIVVTADELPNCGMFSLPGFAWEGEKDWTELGPCLADVAASLRAEAGL
jgi:hypothetical protein